MTAPIASPVYWFDGILEGPRGAYDQRLQQHCRALNDGGLVQLHLEMESGRFSLLADDEVRVGAGPDDPRAESFVRHLSTLVKEVLDEGGAIESTLRCTVVDGDQVQETLFAVRQMRLQPLTRERPVTADDRARFTHLEPEPALILPVGGKVLAVVALLLLLAGGLVAWQSGMFYRAFAVEAVELSEDLGDFNGLLTIEVKDDWGSYSIKLTRGERYPANAAEVDALVNAATTTAQRAAINVVADGGTLWLRVQDEHGKVLTARPMSLRNLLTQEDGKVEERVPGHRHAHQLRLALDDGAPAK